jgi:hypothetical protein
LFWLQYDSQNTAIILEHVKIIKNKNVIPAVETHKTALVFTNAGMDDIFFRLWNACGKRNPGSNHIRLEHYTRRHVYMLVEFTFCALSDSISSIK